MHRNLNKPVRNYDEGYSESLDSDLANEFSKLNLNSEKKLVNFLKNFVKKEYNQYKINHGEISAACNLEINKFTKIDFKSPILSLKGGEESEWIPKSQDRVQVFGTGHDYVDGVVISSI